MTRILDVLIKEAANCESYASDLFISWEYIMMDIRKASELSYKQGFTYYFGFRNLGVDHESFIQARRGRHGNIWESVSVIISATYYCKGIGSTRDVGFPFSKVTLQVKAFSIERVFFIAKIYSNADNGYPLTHSHSQDCRINPSFLQGFPFF